VRWVREAILRRTSGLLVWVGLGFVEPILRLDVIFGNAPTVLVHVAQLKLGARVALVSRFGNHCAACA